MRGGYERSGALFSYLDVDARVLRSHRCGRSEIWQMRHRLFDSDLAVRCRYAGPAAPEATVEQRSILSR
jgi:hypothetical protein